MPSWPWSFPPQAQTRPLRVSARLPSVPVEIAEIGQFSFGMARGTEESLSFPWPSSPVWLFPQVKARPDWIGGWWGPEDGCHCADASVAGHTAPIDATATTA